MANGSPTGERRSVGCLIAFFVLFCVSNGKNLRSRFNCIAAIAGTLYSQTNPSSFGVDVCDCMVSNSGIN